MILYERISAPNTVTLIEDTDQTTEADVAVIYKQQQPDDDDFDYFLFSLEPSETPDVQINKTEVNETIPVIFHNLTSGSVYNVTLVIYRHELPSFPETIQIATGNFKGFS